MILILKSATTMSFSCSSLFWKQRGVSFVTLTNQGQVNELCLESKYTSPIRSRGELP
ncbi:hypothetical protein BDV12DRAFT_144439 [Aspergillus spectabilis]